MNNDKQVQDLSPSVRISLERIGFKELKRRVKLETPIGLLQLDLTLDLYISISKDRRGAHLSRTAETALEVLETSFIAKSVEEHLELLARHLLKKHEYAEQVEVKATFTYYVEVEYGKLKGTEPVVAEVEISLDRNGRKRWSVAVTVVGLTACPSAQQAIATLLKREPHEVPTHMQKVLVKGKVSGEEGFVRIERLARALHKSLSAPAFTLLKRADEAELILRAFSNAKLLEDVVRDSIANIALEFKDLSLDTLIEVEAESFESIHPHNLYAYKRVALKEALEALAFSESQG
ncbi:MAG: GTP cyclohydrolase MptA [Acidilobaceae archaeon]